MTYRKSPAKPVRTRKLKQTGRKPSSHRFIRFLFSPFILAPLIIITLLGAGVMTYYYFRYTDLIDAGLRGDIFVRSSGIYAAPPELRTGGPMKMNDLVAYLRRVGYQERSTAQNEKRGQYLARGGVVEIYPGSEAVVDGAKMFRNLRGTFGRGGGGH